MNISTTVMDDLIDAFKTASFVSTGSKLPTSILDTHAGLVADYHELMVKIQRVPDHTPLSMKKLKCVHMASDPATFSLNNFSSPYVIDSVANPTANQIPLSLIDNSDITDMRQLGGGLTDDYLKQNMHKDKKIYNMSDIGNADGYPLAIGSTIVIEIPDAVFSQFSEQKVYEIINKYKAVGVNCLLANYTPITIAN